MISSVHHTPAARLTACCRRAVQRADHQAPVQSTGACKLTNMLLVPGAAEAHQRSKRIEADAGPVKAASWGAVHRAAHGAPVPWPAAIAAAGYCCCNSSRQQERTREARGLVLMLALSRPPAAAPCTERFIKLLCPGRLLLLPLASFISGYHAADSKSAPGRREGWGWCWPCPSHLWQACCARSCSSSSCAPACCSCSHWLVVSQATTQETARSHQGGERVGADAGPVQAACGRRAVH